MNCKLENRDSSTVWVLPLEMAAPQCFSKAVGMTSCPSEEECNVWVDGSIEVQRGSEGPSVEGEE